MFKTQRRGNIRNRSRLDGLGDFDVRRDRCAEHNFLAEGGHFSKLLLSPLTITDVDVTRCAWRRCIDSFSWELGDDDAATATGHQTKIFARTDDVEAGRRWTPLQLLGTLRRDTDTTQTAMTFPAVSSCSDTAILSGFILYSLEPTPDMYAPMMSFNRYLQNKSGRTLQSLHRA